MWEIPSDVPELTGLKMLIISLPFPQNGTEAETLGRMMSACKLLPHEYAVIPLPSEARLSWQALRGMGAPDRVLLAGISPAQLGIQALLRPLSCNSFLGARFVPAPRLDVIASQAPVKRQLWEEGLKPCFDL